MVKDKTFGTLIIPMEDVLNEMFDLKAMATIFAEALHRMHEMGVSPSDETIPCYADILERQGWSVMEKYNQMYNRYTAICRGEEVKANE